METLSFYNFVKLSYHAVNEEFHPAKSGYLNSCPISNFIISRHCNNLYMLHKVKLICDSFE